VLGLIRDMIVASVLGAGAMSDVFLFANRIPNFLRRLFAEGAFSKAYNVGVGSNWHIEIKRLGD